jgi:hypothetical protein
VRIVVAFISVVVAVGGCAAVAHGVSRWLKWSRLPGPHLPWWQTLPLGFGRFLRLEPFEPDTYNEQLGTTTEILAGILAVVVGILAFYSVVNRTVGVRSPF